MTRRARIRSRHFLLAVLITLSTVLAASMWLSRCPVEIRLLGVESGEGFHTESARMSLVNLRVLNRRNTSLEFDEGVTLEARVAGRWTEIANRWPLRTIGPSIFRRPSGIGDVMLVVPESAEECRIHLRYRYVGKAPLPLGIQMPLGIHTPFARYEAPSKLSLRAQQITVKLSRPLYDWLWPPWPPVPATPSKPPVSAWRKTTAQIAFPDGLIVVETGSRPAE